jgi:hypothetical protein
MKKNHFLLLAFIILYLSNSAQTVDQIKDETIRSIWENDPMGKHGFVYDTTLDCNQYSRPECWDASDYLFYILIH